MDFILNLSIIIIYILTLVASYKLGYINGYSECEHMSHESTFNLFTMLLGVRKEARHYQRLYENLVDGIPEELLEKKTDTDGEIIEVKFKQ